jgi:hypothetical protein
MESEIPGHNLLRAFALKRFEYLHRQMFPERLRIDLAHARNAKGKTITPCFWAALSRGLFKARLSYQRRPIIHTGVCRNFNSFNPLGRRDKRIRKCLNQQLLWRSLLW